MKTIKISDITRSVGSSGIFQGYKFGANISFFVVKSRTGQGADKHRHPYEETFVILDGTIEAIVGGETKTVEAGNIIVIPPDTWHEFKNISDHPLLMVNIHPVPKMIQEFWSDKNN